MPTRASLDLVVPVTVSSTDEVVPCTKPTLPSRAPEPLTTYFAAPNSFELIVSVEPGSSPLTSRVPPAALSRT